ncbi:MAG: polynucleotide adenylyltransferase PcnB [Legionellales bacterium]|jgi:poly(A) polymerase|nr:polynucleotide adenylyltransferase PcnB [Legionellales bacterium]
MIKCLRAWFKSKDNTPEPKRFSDHEINPGLYSKNAVKVIKDLSSAGFKAYLVGGAVRDALVGISPKDFDVATDAHPEQVKKIFRNSILIGRRFKLVHVRFGREIIEVATFRSGDQGSCFGKEKRLFGKKGLLLRDNIYGAIDDDVWRRDFTINSLYYDAINNQVLDYTGGMDDLKAKRVKVIGDPVARYKEDPVRMIRAIRYAAKLDFKIEKKTDSAIRAHKDLFENVSPDRVFVEIIKTFYGGFALKAFDKLAEYDFINLLFPKVYKIMTGKLKGYNYTDMLISRALYNTDIRYKSKKPLSTAFIFVVFLWPVLQHNLYKLSKADGAFINKVKQAIKETLKNHDGPISIPKGIAETCEHVWLLQFKLMYREDGKIQDVLDNPKFRMAYDFLVLRAQAGEEVYNLASWWNDFIAADDEKKSNMILSYTERAKSMRAKHDKPRNGHRRGKQKNRPEAAKN